MNALGSIYASLRLLQIDVGAMKVPTLPPVPNPAVSTNDWLANLQQTLGWLVRATAFWLAIALPFLYLPLVVAGPVGRSELLAFAGLLVLNMVALVLGHGYRR